MAKVNIVPKTHSQDNLVTQNMDDSAASLQFKI